MIKLTSISSNVYILLIQKYSLSFGFWFETERMFIKFHPRWVNVFAHQPSLVT